MITKRCSPYEADERACLEALNACFAGWGGPEEYRWAFRRTGDGLEADLLTIEEGGRPIAGSGIVYRRLAAGGSTSRAAVFCGSWTLPAERGRGAFSQIIEATLETARERGAATCLAFVRSDNASRRRLEAVSRALWPTWYCRSGDAAPPGGLPADPVGPVDCDPARFSRGRGGTTFVYSERDWVGQFLSRPGRTECVGTSRWSAVLERVAGFDRLHAIDAGEPEIRLSAMTALAARARGDGRRLFCFTTDPAEAAALHLAGFDSTEGFLWASSPAGLTGWRLENGDRM